MDANLKPNHDPEDFREESEPEGEEPDPDLEDRHSQPPQQLLLTEQHLGLTQSSLLLVLPSTQYGNGDHCWDPGHDSEKDPEDGEGEDFPHLPVVGKTLPSVAPTPYVQTIFSELSSSRK